MSNISYSLKLLMNLAKAQAIMSRRFDSLTVHGLSFNDFIILYLLHQAPGQKLRRSDLAEKMGLTASGVTRLLLPIEKVGLINRESNARDARVSYAALTEAGSQIFEDAKSTANAVAEEVLPEEAIKDAQEIINMFRLLGGTII